jgi:3-phosphoshikimate 1-carboxyvinyltransferase
MSVFTLSHPTKIIDGNIILPGSKSITNRLLIMQAISNNKSPIRNISTADDSKLMQQFVGVKNGIVDIENAGTCMRFLTAYYSLFADDVLLEGNMRMHERPIKPLVDALTRLGADIEYVEKNGFPPLRIKGKKLFGGEINIDASISSQFISAILLIAPLLETKLIIHASGEPTSVAYNKLTVEMMRKNGINIECENNKYIVYPSSYHFSTTFCEPDWSAASYFYSIVSLAPKAILNIIGLTKNDIQPDKHVDEIMSKIGVCSQFLADGLYLKSSEKKSKCQLLNMSDCPDLVPTLAVTCAGKNIETTFTQIGHLQYKETNRLVAVSNELNKCGFNVSHDQSSIKITPVNTDFASHPVIKTYGDHRMAMAFAPLALIFDKVDIENPEVVEKSFPDFWNQLKHIGFSIEQ